MRTRRITLGAVAMIVGLLAAGPVPPTAALAAPHTADPALAATVDNCPADGVGGPFYRVCSSTMMHGPTTFAGFQLGITTIVTLPCPQPPLVVAPDLVSRKLTSKGNVKVTSDEGYAYLAFYVAGDEFEVGLEHLSQPASPYVYDLYIRHGKTGAPKASSGFFWQGAQKLSCATPITLAIAVTNFTYNRHIPSVDTRQLLPQPVICAEAFQKTAAGTTDASTPCDRYLTPDSATDSTVCPRPSDTFGKGCTQPLTNPAWSGGCTTCGVAMLTAIAQNCPGGSIPTTPLADGAAFGPVKWGSVNWGQEFYGPNPTDATVYGGSWDASISTQHLAFGTPTATITVAGAEPSYAATLKLTCVASPTGPDQWACPPR